MKELRDRAAKAVRFFWATRKGQQEKQANSGKRDQGIRGSVTGGAQMDGFVDLVRDLLIEQGVPETAVFQNKCVDLPGFFRPTKEWDLLVVWDGELIAAMEFKSQVGPSFGNNFNNRTEEALGSATDLWTAYREGAFNDSTRPWLGYIMLLEETEKSTAPVRNKESHFNVFKEFKGSSYAKRYELFCRKLVRERLYDASCLILSEREAGLKGSYREPSRDLAFESFVTSLIAKAVTVVKMKMLHS